MKRKLLIPGLLVVSLLATSVTMISSCKKKTDDPEKVTGCTNSSALNFNALANEDDGTCVIPEQKERAILLDFTATWCSPCGGQGIPMFEGAITANPNEVVPMGCHNSDEMSNTITDALLTDYNVSGIPTLVVGNQFDVWGSSALNSAVLSNNSSAPTVNACAVMTYSGTSITIKTQTKFFLPTSGDYYLATYFVENGLVYYQESASYNPFTHKHVLRGVAAGNEHGELIATGTIAANKVVNKDYTYTAPSAWTMANVYVACVIWKKTGSVWTAENAWQSKAN